MNAQRLFRGLFVGVAGVLIAAGCAHRSAEKSIDEKLSREPELKGSGDLTREARHLIETSTSLSADQRTRLIAVNEEVSGEMSRLYQDSLKLRSLLLKGLAASPYDAGETDRLKSRIREVEDRRLSLLFSTIEKVNQILGHQASKLSRLSTGLFEIYGGHI